MNKYLAIPLALAFLCSPAFAQRKKKNDDEARPKLALRVQSMDKVQQVDSGCFVYALPRTVLRLTLTVERRIFSAGPYAAYAEKYLGITGLQKVNSTRYHLKSAALSAYVEADEQHFYMVQPAGDMKFSFLKMSKDGLMLLPENFGRGEDTGDGSVGFGAVDWQPFTTMAVDAMFRDVKPKSTPKKPAANAAAATAEEEEKEEEAEVVVAQPVHISQQVKTQEERASEVAQFIFNLRKRKYELVTGDVDIAFSSNDALKVALNEIRSMESEHLSLFVGKTVRQEATYTCDVAPVPMQTSYAVFTFSAEQGVLPPDGEGRVITLELRPENKYATFDISPLAEDNSGFRVRLPDVAQVRLLNEKEELQRGRFRIYQNGKMVIVRAAHFLSND
ncbi:MAG: DUF4831 family protein [Prevotellaceae bacterium]|nr:DUF4831 family protein [Prevotellaceae bacterium]